MNGHKPCEELHLSFPPFWFLSLPELKTKITSWIIKIHRPITALRTKFGRRHWIFRKMRAGSTCSALRAEFLLSLPPTRSLFAGYHLSISWLNSTLGARQIMLRNVCGKFVYLVWARAIFRMRFETTAPFTKQMVTFWEPRNIEKVPFIAMGLYTS